MSVAFKSQSDRNMIGMARLSCLPCRRRKSKCDREEPCSSCVLRNTEKFCYSAEVEEDGAKFSSKRSERGQSTNSPTEGSSPGSKYSSKDAALVKKPHKRLREDNGKASNKGEGSVILDRHNVEKTITAMEESIRQLKNAIGVKEESRTRLVPERMAEMVHWNDVAYLLPSKSDCDQILDYFFSTSHWQSTCIHKGIFHKDWDPFINGDRPVPRAFVGLFCGIVAQTLLFLPAYHPLSKVSYHDQHQHYCRLGHAMLEFAYHDVLDDVVPGILEAQARMTLLLYMSFSGCSSAAWLETGRLIRINKTLALYDEDRWPMQELSDWDLEVRRRVGWDAAMTDRWTSLYYQGIPDLPESIRLKNPNYYADECYDADTGQMNTVTPSFHSSQPFCVAKKVVSDAAYLVNDFLQDFKHMSPDKRYQRAREVSATITKRMEAELSPMLRYENACKPDQLQDAEAVGLAAQSVIAYTSNERLLCTVMRQFLLDPGAPIDLRVAALEHARKVIETTSTIVTLSSSPYISFNCAWCSGHLFCAASTFAIVYLDESDQNLQDLNWFAAKIFEVIEALSFLSSKDMLARRCEELLTALCTSKDWLRERFLASRMGKVSNVSQRVPPEIKGDFTHRQRLERAKAGNASNVDGVLDDNLVNKDYQTARKRSSADLTKPLHYLPVEPMYKEDLKALTTAQGGSPKVISTSPNTNGSIGSMMNTSNTSTLGPLPIQRDQYTVPDQDQQQQQQQPYNNWPLLDEQQWFMLLNTLEQDMNSLPQVSMS